MRYELEVGARNVEDALSAWYGGADRVELYVSPTEGALTPSAGLVRNMIKVKKAAGIGLGIFAMIRPRSGDSLYTDAEFDVMLEDTEILNEAGAEGFMSGIVTAEGELDVRRMKMLLDRIPGKRFTLHRAFESLRDRKARNTPCSKPWDQAFPFRRRHRHAPTEALPYHRNICAPAEP